MWPMRTGHPPGVLPLCVPAYSGVQTSVGSATSPAGLHYQKTRSINCLQICADNLLSWKVVCGPRPLASPAPPRSALVFRSDFLNPALQGAGDLEPCEKRGRAFGTWEAACGSRRRGVCFRLFGSASPRGPSGSSPAGRGRGQIFLPDFPAYGGVCPSKFRAGGADRPHSLWVRRGGGTFLSNQSTTKAEGRKECRGPPLHRGPSASLPRRERPRALGMLCPPALVLSSETDFSERKCGAGQHVAGRHVVVDVQARSGANSNAPREGGCKGALWPLCDPPDDFWTGRAGGR